MTGVRTTMVLVGVTIISALATSAPSMVLLIDEDTDQAWLKNTGPAPLLVTGYQIDSSGGDLDSIGWESITDAAVTRPDDVIAQLGAGALDFFKAITAITLGEANNYNYAVFQPGAPWSIGQPAPGISPADLTFQYALDDYTIHQGGIEIVPEPATLMLLGLGALSLLRKRRKQ